MTRNTLIQAIQLITLGSSLVMMSYATAAEHKDTVKPHIATQISNKTATKGAAKNATASNTRTTDSSAQNKVEFSNTMAVTQEEIAAVNVLGEICPKILGNDPHFKTGYAKVLGDMLPATIKDPVLALDALKDDREYQAILQQARVDASKYSLQKNREVCQEIAQTGNEGRSANTKSVSKKPAKK